MVMVGCDMQGIINGVVVMGLGQNFYGVSGFVVDGLMV